MRPFFHNLAAIRYDQPIGPLHRGVLEHGVGDRDPLALAAAFSAADSAFSSDAEATGPRRDLQHGRGQMRRSSRGLVS